MNHSLINFFPISFSNKAPVIRDILKSNQIARDSQHFEGKSKFGKSGGREGHTRGEKFIDFPPCFFW